jgi:hypothetical protein
MKRTDELEGAELDYAVAVADRRVNPYIHEQQCWVVVSPGQRPYHFAPSNEWAIGGPIIERERITIFSKDSGAWAAEWYAPIGDGTYQLHRMDGPTPLIAAMRAFVASHHGNEIEIPEQST